MVFPLLQTKLQLPAIPKSSLYSDRIKSLMIRDYRLAILVAPAGFGKTTSVLLSLQKHRKQVKWYRLEHEDSFLSVFYRHLLNMLFADMDRGEVDSFHTFRSLQDIQEEYPLLNAQICQDMTYLFGDCTKTLFLVFDDYHNISENDMIRETMRYFASNMPPCVHIILTSRKDPGILTGKLMMAFDCKQFEASDLLFQKEEVKELVHHVYQMKLSDEQIAFIIEESEGWIAGINIICHNSEFYQNQLEKFSHHHKNLLFSVFLNDYLLQIDEKKRELLIKLSVLSDFSSDEISGLFGEEDANEFIAWLESSNLYVQKMQTSASDEIRVRFHSLFQGELQTLFEKNYSTSEKNELYSKIANYYQSLDTVKSLYYHLKAKNEKAALSIAKQKIQSFFVSGRPEECFPILNVFDKKQIESNPYLLFMDAMRRINTDRNRAQTSIILAMDAFKRIRDYSFFMNGFGMIMVIAFQTNDFNVLGLASKKIPSFSIILRGGNPRIQLIISYFISLTGQDKLKSATKYTKYLDRAVINDEMWHFSYLMIRGIYYYRKGDFKEARQNLDSILTHPVISSNDQWRIIGLVSCCNVSFLVADQELMGFFVQEFSLLGERYNSDFSLGYAHYISGFQRFQAGNEQKAIESFKNAAKHYRQYGSEVLANGSDLFVVFISEKDPSEEGIQKAQELADFFRKENPGHGIYELAQSILAILYKRRGKYEEAEKWLQECFEICKKKGVIHNIYGLHLQLADLFLLKSGACVEGPQKYDEQTSKLRILQPQTPQSQTPQSQTQKISEEELQKAEFHAKQWLALGEKNHYLYAKEMDFETLGRVIGYLKTTSVTSVQRLYLEELEAFYSRKEQVEVHEECIYVKLFGSFELKYRDLILSEKDFKTKKVSGLFRYLLANPKAQTREYLASIFWSDSNRKSSYTSLRVAIYELRKSLSSTELAFDKDGALLEENDEGFFKNALYHIRSDAQEFESLYHAWKSEETIFSLSSLLELCRLYTGSFLENGDYDDWAMIQATNYSSMYFEVVHSLGRLSLTEIEFESKEVSNIADASENTEVFEDKSEDVQKDADNVIPLSVEVETELERALTFDPLNEECCSMLLNLYYKSDQVDRAKVLEKKFRKRFKKEMGVEAQLSL